MGPSSRSHERCRNTLSPTKVRQCFLFLKIPIQRNISIFPGNESFLNSTVTIPFPHGYHWELFAPFFWRTPKDENLNGIYIYSSWNNFGSIYVFCVRKCYSVRALSHLEVWCSILRKRMIVRFYLYPFDASLWFNLCILGSIVLFCGSPIPPWGLMLFNP